EEEHVLGQVLGVDHPQGRPVDDQAADEAAGGAVLAHDALRRDGVVDVARRGPDLVVHQHRDGAVAVIV
ncbi:MAG: hypothetical protein AVDCRST_MAG90-1308, partial [uncultured Microvirga sp.]